MADADTGATGTGVADWQYRIAIALALTAAPVAALAQDDAGSDWRFQVTPYAWATGLSGELTPYRGASTIAFQESFSDILDDLDFAMFVAATARRDRLVFAGDLTFARTSRAGFIAPGVNASGKLTQWSLTALAGYSVLRDETATIDVMGGIRAWSLQAEVEVAAIGVQKSGSKRFTDPIIAVRGTFNIAPKWSMSFYGDYGGFGVGSDQTWQVIGAASYALSDTKFLSIGYRRLAVDYESDGGTRVDASMQGPFAGLTFRF